MLVSAAQLVSEEGYARMTVARVTGRARVSRRTFYDLFEDREDCFLAAFDAAVAELVDIVGPAFEGGGGRWRERVRAGLRVLLEALDARPGLALLVVVDALGAGVRVAERRTRVFDALRATVDEGRAESTAGREPPPLTAEGVVGAVFNVIHVRVLEQGRPSGRRRAPSIAALTELLNELMAMIVLPYQGQAAARKELERPLPRLTPASRTAAGVSGELGHSERDPLEGLAMRLTYRTLKVLEVVTDHPGASNREVADAAGVSDQGQISKLLARLERLGLLLNTGEGQAKGEPNAWRLTPRGKEVEHATRVRPRRVDRAMNGTGGTHR